MVTYKADQTLRFPITKYMLPTMYVAIKSIVIYNDDTWSADLLDLMEHWKKAE